MLPMELKVDNNGLFYIKDYIENHPESLINVYNRGIPNNYFYELLTSSDYAIKYSFLPHNKDGMINMLLHLQKLQDKITNIDFPIGYYIEDDDIYGQIIRFYKKAPSIAYLTQNKDINEVSKYYYHCEDSIHNLYLLLLDILNFIEELFENNVFYTDIHTGNFVIDNNKVKIIDFDYQYVTFNKKKSLELLKSILFNYETMIYIINKNFDLGTHVLDNPENFKDVKIMLKQMENSIRKR